MDVFTDGKVGTACSGITFVEDACEYNSALLRQGNLGDTSIPCAVGGSLQVFCWSSELRLDVSFFAFAKEIR